MPISVILDVATGLVFLYFLLALIASSIQELIAGIFAWRGTYLSKGVDVILDNEKNATFLWHGIGDFIKAHFTFGTGQTALDRLNIRLQKQGTAIRQGDQTLKKILAIQTHPLLRSTPSTLPSYVPARNFALALLDILRDGSQSANFAQVRATIATLPAGDLKTLLSAFLVESGNDIDKFRQRLEQWFDDAMDRVSGIYNRLSHYVMLILGFIFAVGLNINSIQVATSLAETPAMRAAAIASASTANAFVTPTQPAQSAQTSAPPAASGAAAAAGPPPAQDLAPHLTEAWAALQTLENERLPFGWNFSKPAQGSSFFQQNMTASTIPGWIITAAAIAFGAPFWFGLLQNLANMRSAGPAPSQSSNDSSR